MKNPFCLADGEKICFEEHEKRRKKGGVQLPSRPYVKHYEKDFFQRKMPKTARKSEKTRKKGAFAYAPFSYV